MEISALEKFIRQCGTVEKAAKVLGTSHQNLSLMRNGRTCVKYTFALKISKYMLEHANVSINILDLVSPKERNELKSLFFSFSKNLLKLTHLPLIEVTEVNALEKFIRQCGTVEKAAKILGTSHQNVSSMRNGRTWVKYTFALKISKYMLEHANILINTLDLVSPKERNELKSLFFSFSKNLIKITHLPLIEVCCNESIPNLSDKMQYPLNQLKLIVIDERNQLIANEETYFLYQMHGKKTIPALRLSLLDLQDGKYEVSYLKDTFDLIERTTIGINLEKFIGNRKGQRTNLKNPMENSPQIYAEKSVKTNEFISELLDLGSDCTYKQLKKIILYGSSELINQVRNEGLAISKAAKVAESSAQEQKISYRK